MGIVVSVCLFVSIPFSCLCMCMCTYYFVSMYMKIMGIRLCVYIKHVSKPPHGVQWGMVGMLLFLRDCVDNCIILCYVFVFAEYTTWSSIGVSTVCV